MMLIRKRELYEPKDFHLSLNTEELLNPNSSICGAMLKSEPYLDEGCMDSHGGFSFSACPYLPV